MLQKNKENGSVMLVLLIFVGLVGVMANMASSAGVTYIDAAQKVKAAKQVQDLERAIRVKTSCTQTIRLVEQNGATQAALVDESGSPISSTNSGSSIKIGNWVINIASWNSGSRQLSISARNNNTGPTTVAIFTDEPMVCD